MLATQYSFGITVGAPVVFFGASFIYTLVENYSQYGDNDLSLALGIMITFARYLFHDREG